MKARDNPFRSERMDALNFRFSEDSWDDCMERLAALSYRAAIVGPDGSGKTTLLDGIASRLEARDFRAVRLFLNGDSKIFDGELTAAAADAGPRDIILFDGADFLGRAAWLRFKRSTRCAGGLIVTSHRPGLLPTLAACRTTPGLLDGLVSELIAGQRGPQAPSAGELFTRHGGNIRDCFRELYDCWAETG